MKLGRRPVDENIRFWEKVNIQSKEECWIWTGTKNKKGYGWFKNGAGKTVTAHRFSWNLANEMSPAGELFVCHKCDNPSCVNPDHLFLGTAKDNVQDRVKKGRSRYNPARGDNHPKHKVSDSEVLSMKDEYSKGASCIDISKRYGITRGQVTKIVFGRARIYA